MKTYIFLAAALLAVTAAAAQKPITEENYLHEDSVLWARYSAETDDLAARIRENAELWDSLKPVYDSIYEAVSQRNRELAIEYASVPSGLRRLYMVRLGLPKATLSEVLDRLPERMRESDYGQAIRRHIDTEQLSEGDRLFEFEAATDTGEPLDWRSLDGKRVLLLYGGIDCMGQEGRDYLAGLYDKTSREDLAILVYWPVSSLEALKNMHETYPSEYIFFSDFRQDLSPMKIVYGTQATPTCFLTGRDGTIRVKSVGLATELFDKIIFEENE